MGYSRGRSVQLGQFDANATKDQLEQMEREFARKREAAALRLAAELARLSEERTFTDEHETTWTYLVVDGSFARLCGCDTDCELLVVPDELGGYPVREIDAEALSNLDVPCEITCAAGVESIGPYAFRGCVSLRRLVLPAATSIFSSSWIARCPAIEELVLPGALEVIEADVFACPTVRILEIGEGTRAVRPGAFDKRLNSIGACGLSVECAIKTVRIDVSEPIEGRSSFLLRFPETSRSVHGFLLALGAFGQFYLPDIMAQYDNCIASARDYHAPGDSANVSAYEQVKLITGRLQDSVLLTEVNRKRYRALIADNIQEICVDIARHDDRNALGALADLGLLTAENIGSVIDAVNRLQDASMTGYLLELQRLRFGHAATDFDL